MALARLALRNLQKNVPAPLSSSASRFPAQKQGWASPLLRRLSSAVEEKPGGGTEVAVTEGSDDKKSNKLFPKRKTRRGLWRRNNNRDFVPALTEFFPSALGDALIRASDNINRLMENLSPSHLMGRAKEQDDCYKLRYHVPGLSKDDVKITVENGVLNIKGEHKEEEEEGSDDEFWSSTSYGYYNTSVVLPGDAKVDGIKAELKNGVLNVVVPKTENAKKDVKEIQLQ